MPTNKLTFPITREKFIDIQSVLMKFAMERKAAGQPFQEAYRAATADVAEILDVPIDQLQTEMGKVRQAFSRNGNGRAPKAIEPAHGQGVLPIEESRIVPIVSAEIINPAPNFAELLRAQLTKLKPKVGETVKIVWTTREFAATAQHSAKTAIKGLGWNGYSTNLQGRELYITRK